MIDITLALIGIIVLFVIFILLRSAFSFKVCALCGAVSLVWITLLVLFYLGYSIDLTILALLMGGSVVGSMYLLEEKLSEKYQLFKLPYFLTFVYIAHFLLTKNIQIEAVYVLLVVWLFMIFVHTVKGVESLKVVGKKIIECCKNW